jgi:CHRD domain
MLRKLPALSAPLLILVAAAGMADDDRRPAHRVAAQLRPTNEVPALSSTGHGRFQATIDDTNQTISFELSYDDLEAAPVQAHIHVGQRHVNGGVSVFLCGPAPQQPCAPSPAKIIGVLTPANIVGPVEQGIDPATDAASGFVELVRLLRSGHTYANVHSTKFPGGEIRGQVRPERRK